MVAAVPALISAVGAAAAGTTVFGLALLIGAGSFALSAIGQALTPKQKFDGGASTLNGSITQQVREPITTHKIIYGEARVSGPIVFPASTLENKYLHMVIVLAAHEVEEIGEIWLNEESIPPDCLDAAGMVTQGKYAGLVRIIKHLGGDGQTADTDLVAEVSDWTTAHRIRGRAYVYIRYEFNRDVFPTGGPNASAWIKGKKLFDVRGGTTAWSPNTALAAYDYLDNAKYGVRKTSAMQIDADYAGAAANLCEEIVTVTNAEVDVAAVAAGSDILTLDGAMLALQTGDRVEIETTGTAPAGLDENTDYFVIVYQRRGIPRIKLAATLAEAIAGTAVDITDAGTGTHTIVKTGEPRYFCGGIIDTANEPGRNLLDIISAMAGDAVKIGRSWKLYGGAYVTPSITLNEGHLRAPIRVVTKVSRDDRFNAVKGIYASPLNLDQPSDYPAVTNATYQTADGGEQIPRDLPLPFTQRSGGAQRIAKIALEESRQELVIECPCNLSVLRVQQGNTILINNTRMGFSAKPFKVVKVKLLIESRDDAPVIGVNLVLRETASGVYDWNSGEETAVDLAPNTTLPSFLTVSAPSGVSFDSVAVETLDGDTVYRMLLHWSQHPDTFVLQRGSFEIQSKKSSDADFNPLPPVDGSATDTEFGLASVGIAYDVRIRAVNNIGVRSSWQTLTGVIAGSAGGVTSTEDWGSIADSPTSSEDWGSIADVPTSDEDWGGLSS